MSFITHEQNGLVWLTADTLQPVHHGFSTRLGGVSAAPWDSLNLRPAESCGDDPAAVAENYRRFFSAIGSDVSGAVLAHQTHTDHVRIVTEADAGKGLLRPRDYSDVDGLVTQVPGLTLVVFSADCGNILLHDPVTGAVGAVHAGWRGCAAGIVEKTVRLMQTQYGADPAHLHAALGPCIGACCFETDSDVPDAMRAALGRDAEPLISYRAPKFYLDLAGLNRLWLLRAGVQQQNIDVSGICTACHPELFWSHRKMGNARGVQAAAITCPKEGL